jgi:2-polyprenyl-6-methoxyphenol hydroxylase-like FAD-dependent oxidoreductase
MTTSKNLPIIVAGGGIGGLAAALALAKKGQHVKILEKAPEVGEIGYGIQMGPNGYGILKRLGLTDALAPHSFFPDALVMADAITGKELTRINLGDRFEERYKYPYFVIHRRDLHGALHDACRAQALISFEQGAKEVTGFDDRSGTVTVHCADGSSYDGKALIGAEGLRSPTRAQVAPDGLLRNTGHVVYRGLVPVEEVIDKTYLNSMVIYVGPGMHLVQYRLRGGTVMNNVCTFESPGFKRGEKKFGGTEELFGAFEKCDPKVRDMLRYVSLDRKWILHDRDPITNWTSGNVTLLGDAAHLTLQYLAQGAIMSMEDAIVLAHEVDMHGEDFHAAFLAYQSQRLNRTARVVLTARLFGEICHAADGARLLRNELVERRDPNAPWEVDWLYNGITLGDEQD